MIGAIFIFAASFAVSALYGYEITAFIFVAAVLGFFISWGSRRVLAKTAGQTNAKLKIHDGWCTQFITMLSTIQNNNILGYYQDNTSRNLKDFIRAAVAEDKKTVFWSCEWL